MAIFRTRHNQNYTVVNNTIITDNRLTWKAKGIWLYAFSRMDDWEFHLNDLMNQSTDGKDSVNSGLKELEQFGYLKRAQLRDKGRFSKADWEFFETPQEEVKERLPKADFPATVIPEPEKPPLISTEYKQVLKTTAAAAGFSDLLKDIDIPKSDKMWLAGNYDIAVVSKAIAWATHPLTKINTTLSQAIKWACKNNPDIPVAAVDKGEENKATATRYRQQADVPKDVYFEVLTAGVEIGVNGGNTKPVMISYSENGFKDQLECALRKRGIIPKKSTEID